VAEYRKGKKGLIGFFMGEVMRASQGKAEPKATNALLLKKLA
jgi:aspartyl-tRNA(Asn)/glutamyl-tRNA(Gln) amidotransferase subunit B